MDIISKDNPIDFHFVKKNSLLLDGSQKKEINVYDVQSVANMHQIIGYAKYKYSDKIVLYRGVNKLYNNVLPSLYRGVGTKKRNDKWKNLLNVIKEVKKIDSLKNKLKIDELQNDFYKKIVVESVLQHYGYKTTCLDLVDNVWVALWFGFYKYVENKGYSSGRYATYIPRIARDYECYFSGYTHYQYIILFAIDEKLNVRGEIHDKPKKNYAVDLREALPSIFIRPHAQHAWILKSYNTLMDERSDFANNVIGILRFKSNDVKKWLGNSELLSQNMLFPDPVADYGYDALLAENLIPKIIRFYTT